MSPSFFFFFFCVCVCVVLFFRRPFLHAACSITLLRPLSPPTSVIFTHTEETRSPKKKKRRGFSLRLTQDTHARENNVPFRPRLAALSGNRAQERGIKRQGRKLLTRFRPCLTHQTLSCLRRGRSIFGRCMQTVDTERFRLSILASNTERFVSPPG